VQQTGDSCLQPCTDGCTVYPAAASQQAVPDNFITLLMRILQARVKAIAEIVSELVAGVKEGRDVDLNNVKREVRIALHECLSMAAKDKWKDKTAS